MSTQSKITNATVIPSNPAQGRYQASLSALFDNGVAEVEVLKWYDDELYFGAQEFVGLTREQVAELWFSKDQAFITAGF
jgi:hypothetical protein